MMVHLALVHWVSDFMFHAAFSAIFSIPHFLFFTLLVIWLAVSTVHNEPRYITCLGAYIIRMCMDKFLSIEKQQKAAAK